MEVFSRAVSLGWPKLRHEDFCLKLMTAHFSEVPVGWPCRNTSPMEVKAFLVDWFDIIFELFPSG